MKSFSMDGKWIKCEMNLTNRMIASMKSNIMIIIKQKERKVNELVLEEFHLL